MICPKIQKVNALFLIIDKPFNLKNVNREHDVLVWYKNLMVLKTPLLNAYDFFVVYKEWFAWVIKSIISSTYKFVNRLQRIHKDTQCDLSLNAFWLPITRDVIISSLHWELCHQRQFVLILR